MKRNMDIKLKGSLRTEKLTLNLLLAVGTIAFCISIVIEFFFQNWMCYTTYHKLHLDYISNVMLGVAGSSMISYISLCFSFINRKNDQINRVLLGLKEIYKDYIALYNRVSYKAASNEKEEDYYLEKTILEKVNKLEKTISDLSAIYGTAEFSSEEIGKIIEVVQDKVTLNLSYIAAFCEFLLLDLIYSPEAKEQTLKYQNSFLPDSLINGAIEMGDVPRNVITKRAENECYQFLLETINSNYSIDQLATRFKELGNELEIAVFEAIMNETLDATHGAIYMTRQLATQTYIRNNIIKIRDKHEKEYFSERLKMRNRMNAAIEKNDKFKNDPCFSSKYGQFMGFLREDRLREAEEILLEIENGVPSE